MEPNLDMDQVTLHPPVPLPPPRLPQNASPAIGNAPSGSSRSIRAPKWALRAVWSRAPWGEQPNRSRGLSLAQRFLSNHFLYGRTPIDGHVRDACLASFLSSVSCMLEARPQLSTQATSSIV